MDVIDMLVGNEDSLQAAGIQSFVGHPPLNLHPRKAGID